MPRDQELHNPVQSREGYCVGPKVFIHQHSITPFSGCNHIPATSFSRDSLNSVSYGGKQRVEAPRYERKGLGFASYLIREGLKLASNGNDVPHLPFRSNPLKLPVRVSALPQRCHVSGGTSPLTRASDPLKRCTRLWAHLTALYGAYGLCVTDAINQLTGRLVLDNGHGQVYGDLVLCSSTAWHPSGYRELRKADYCLKDYTHG